MEKPIHRTSIKLHPLDMAAIAAIKRCYGVSADNEAIRLALRALFADIQKKHGAKHLL